MFPFLGSFPRRLSPLPVRAPPKVALAAPATHPFYLGCLLWQVGSAGAQGFARIREVKTEICLGSEWGKPSTPHHPAEPAFLSQSVPDRSYCAETALDRS